MNLIKFEIILTFFFFFLQKRNNDLAHINFITYFAYIFRLPIIKPGLCSSDEIVDFKFVVELFLFFCFSQYKYLPWVNWVTHIMIADISFFSLSCLLAVMVKISHFIFENQPYCLAFLDFLFLFIFSLSDY